MIHPVVRKTATITDKKLVPFGVSESGGETQLGNVQCRRRRRPSFLSVVVHLNGTVKRNFMRQSRELFVWTTDVPAGCIHGIYDQ
jgi:hypothetical protein